MVYPEHSRIEIWNPTQHPYRHSLAEMSYSNAASGSIVTNGAQALDYVFAFLYPQAKPAVATVAALPSVGNAIGDLRVVNDDGDGKAASYRWWQKEGAASASWHKWADVDWGADSILQAWEQKTAYQWVMRYGYDDVDDTGAVVAGTLAGQVIYGGRTAGSNLTLWPNSGDGAGAVTGYVQVGSSLRPVSDVSYTSGTSANRWLSVYSATVHAGTLTLGSGSIVDSSGSVSFGGNALSTSGSITSGTLVLGSGSVTDSSGTISFGSTALQTTGSLTAHHVTATTAASSLASGTAVGNLTLANGSITSGSGALSFGSANLATTGTLAAGASTLSSGTIGNLSLSGTTVAATGSNASLTLAATGAGSVQTAFPLVTVGQTVTGTVAVTGSVTATTLASGGNLQLSGNTLSVTNAGGGLLLSPNGAGTITCGASVSPTGSFDLGTGAKPWANVYFSGSLGDGTNSITSGSLLSLRSVRYRDAARTVAAQTGDALFYDATNGVWLASVPDTEIVHSTVSGLTTGDAGHTQFALLAGRSGGQTLYGDTGAGGNLLLDSTANASKGYIQIGSYLRPSADGTIDIGASGASLRNVYVTGQLFSARLENSTAAPSASASTKGRIYFNTTDSKTYVDGGGSWIKLGAEKFVLQDTTGWTGAVTTVTYTVSASITDARQSIWAFYDNANSFARIFCDMTLSATQVTVTVTDALAAGTYTLVGIG